jgi:hypothetical protein
VILIAKIEYAVHCGGKHKGNLADDFQRQQRECRHLLLDEEPHDTVAIVIEVLLSLHVLFSFTAKSDHSTGKKKKKKKKKNKIKRKKSPYRTLS